jgi:predicted dehydrogenase
MATSGANAPMSKLRWGVVGVARIAVHKVIPAMQRCLNAEVVAIASRSLEKAQAAAEKLGLPKAYGSYEALLEDVEIDAIYNPLPNHLHVPLSLRALDHDKHVLCEKPLAPSVAEARTLVNAARARPRLKVMEAFMYRFHPQWILAKRLATEGELGPLRTIQTFFSYYNRNPEDIRNQPTMGGGGLLDIGCYPISLSRFLFGQMPQRVFARVDYDPDFNVDRLASGTLDFGVGDSTFTCSTQLPGYQRVNIFCERGRVEIEIPFNAPPDRPCRMWKETSNGVEEISIPVCDQYTLQGDAFSRAVLEDLPVPTPLDDAIENLRVIEACFRSGQSGLWERP